jgi:hypothetical protein
VNHENPEHHAHARHEESDVNVSAIVVFIIVLIVVGVVTQGGVWVLYRHFKQTVSGTGVAEFPLAEESMRRLPPEPRLQVDPRQDLANLRRSEDDVLNSYAWVDRNAGVVRIPIDQAMKLIVDRGMPTR